MDVIFKVTTSCLMNIFLIMVLISSPSEAFVLGKVGNYAVLRGTTVTLQCVPKGHSRDVPSENPGASYVWTDEQGRELIDARYTRQENGDLEIVNVHVGDSGVFKCKVRPPAFFATEGIISKIYEHKLIVYELAGHKFVSSAVIDLSKYSMEIIRTILDKMLKSLCRDVMCLPGNVKSKECGSSEMGAPRCEFSVAYESLNQMADEQCDEDCVREKMYQELKRAETLLEERFLKMSDNPAARLQPDMRTFDTKHLVTCRAGFHLVKSFYKRCFPCLPGHYSKQNSEKCSMCNIGFYQEKYGRHACEKCEEPKTTDTMGAKSKEECIAQEKTGILGNIKEGIASLFSG